MKPPVPVPARGPAADRWSLAAVGLLLATVTVVAYLPALTGAFLWDDAGHVTAPDLRSWTGLFRIWGEIGATQQYYPLLHTAFWIEHRLWGDAVLGYHLINVVWHATAALLFVAVLRRLAVPGATLAGLVFALHPVCVESVAWISEQKNTLSTVFALGAALAWLRFVEEPRRGRYLAATLLFLAALLTKTVTATLPAALLVITWWRQGRLDARRDVGPLLPWFGLGACAGLGTAWLEANQIGAGGQEFALGPAERLLLAGRVPWFYLGKLLWPADLAFFYPRWTLSASEALAWSFPAATALLLAGLVILSRRQRGPLAAVLLFGGLLFPVLGFVNVYPFIFSYVADHFQYLASLAMLAFVTTAAVQGFARLAWPPWAGPALAAAVLAVLGTLTWRQSATYRNVFTLYEATLARNPDSWVAHLNLGTALDEAGRPAKALPHVQRAVQLQPRFAAALNTLGATLMALGRPDEGLAAFRRALAAQPTLTPARVNLGWALANRGQAAEALTHFATAVRERPDFAEAEVKWGLTLAMQDRLREALPHLERAVELQPDDADYRHALGRAFLGVGRAEAAAAQFAEALTLNPAHAGAREGLERLRLSSPGLR